jgi:hypothetical protein
MYTAGRGCSYIYTQPVNESVAVTYVENWQERLLNFVVQTNTFGFRRRQHAEGEGAA